MTATAESDIFLRMAYSETWARANELNDAPHNLVGRRHCASEPDCSQSLSPFWRTLDETVSWCSSGVDPARLLPIAPAALERELRQVFLTS